MSQCSDSGRCCCSAVNTATGQSHTVNHAVTVVGEKRNKWTSEMYVTLNMLCVCFQTSQTVTTQLQLEEQLL